MPEHKILIVEDEEAIAHVMESILSANHYIPLSAKTAVRRWRWPARSALIWFCWIWGCRTWTV